MTCLCENRLSLTQRYYVLMLGKNAKCCSLVAYEKRLWDLLISLSHFLSRDIRLPFIFDCVNNIIPIDSIKRSGILLETGKECFWILFFPVSTHNTHNGQNPTSWSWIKGLFSQSFDSKRNTWSNFTWNPTNLIFSLASIFCLSSRSSAEWCYEGKKRMIFPEMYDYKCFGLISAVPLNVCI